MSTIYGDNVYGYWKCPYCKSIIRGDLRECPNCGSPIPNNIKYMPPNHPEIVKAMKDGTILTKGRTQVDSKGIVAEVVEKEDEKFNPNWKCSFCGYQNRYEDIICKGCGASKTDATSDYFDKEVTFDKKNEENYEKYQGRKIDKEEVHQNYEKTYSRLHRDDTNTKNYLINNKENRTSNYNTLEIIKSIFLLAMLFGVILLAVWFFMPVEKVAKIVGFQWETSVEIKEFAQCEEKDWKLPSDATLEYTKEEIHHYDSVLDHYEIKTKQVPETVLDGYDTEYEDLGNGQFRTVQVPKYKTVYHTETYEEPVYVSVPVYKTRYYYTVDRWVNHNYLKASGNDQNPYYKETDIPTEVENPKYGDLKVGQKNVSCYAIIEDDEGAQYSKNYSYTEWKNLNIGDEIKYKAHRFNNKPIN